jgi:acyl-CoA thioester hydrolase
MGNQYVGWERRGMARSDDRHGAAAPSEATDCGPWDPAATVPAPLSLHRAHVRPEWVDYNGHMSESCYLLVFGDSTDAFFRYFGVDDRYRAAGHSIYTVETHLHYRSEAAQGVPLRLTLQLIGLDAKRLHIFHAMHHDVTGELLATAEQLLLHVDIRTPRVTPIPSHLYERLQTIRTAHAVLPVPDAIGHVMGIGGTDLLTYGHP